MIDQTETEMSLILLQMKKDASDRGGSMVRIVRGCTDSDGADLWIRSGGEACA